MPCGLFSASRAGLGSTLRLQERPTLLLTSYTTSIPWLVPAKSRALSWVSAMRVTAPSPCRCAWLSGEGLEPSGRQ